MYNFIDSLYSHLPESWEDFFIDNEVKEILVGIQESINENLSQKQEVFPEAENVFNAFRYTNKNLLKVVLWGQDPYPGTYIDRKGNVKPIARGLSFSSPREGDIPPSLKNVFKELERSYKELTDREKNKTICKSFSYPKHGDISSWAKQGVLLLNKSLTTLKGISGAHNKSFNPWEAFIVCFLKYIKSIKVIHVFWGLEAQKIKGLEGFSSDLILMAAHPSPMAQNKFMGCNHFVKINRCIRNLFKETGNEIRYQEIDWNIE
jgi:uracil-DNA glycosylase